MPLSVQIPPNDVQNVLDILKLVGNPAEAKKRLTEIVEAQKDVAKLADKFNKETKALEQEKAEHDKKVAEYKAANDLAEKDMAKQIAEIAAKEKKAEDLAQKAEEAIQAADRKVPELAAREARVSDREQAVEDAEAALVAREKALKKQEADYKTKIEKLRALAS